MTETNVFVSSCDRRELARRRRRSWSGGAMSRVSHLRYTAVAFVVVCAGAFIVGRGGI
jgi:hypothetical protein